MAIIGVLVAISIPIFTGQLKKARLATNQANARSAYAAATAEYLTSGDKDGLYNTKTGTFSSSGTLSGGTAAPSGKQITEWTPDEMGADTYSQWFVTIGSDGSIPTFSYAK